MLNIDSLPVLAIALTVVLGACPPEEKVSPCECHDVSFLDSVDVSLTCGGQNTTLEQLKAALNAIGVNDRITIEMDDMNLGTIPTNFFEGFKVQTLDISHCALDRLAGDGGRALSGLEDTLEELVIDSSFTEDNEVTKLELGHLRSLEDLELSYNIITHLSNDWFAQGPPSLKNLIFSNNGIEKVDDRVFANLSNLHRLSFDGNRFGDIKRSMLPSSANSLHDLELENNAFISIPDDLFSNMPALKILTLRTNGITRFPEQTYKPIWTQMDSIDLRGNPLECDSHIDWIKSAPTSAIILGKCIGPHERKDMQLEDLMKQ